MEGVALQYACHKMCHHLKCPEQSQEWEYSVHLSTIIRPRMDVHRDMAMLMFVMTSNGQVKVNVICTTKMSEKLTGGCELLDYFIRLVINRICIQSHFLDDRQTKLA